MELFRKLIPATETNSEGMVEKWDPVLGLQDPQDLRDPQDLWDRRLVRL